MLTGAKGRRFAPTPSRASGLDTGSAPGSGGSYRRPGMQNERISGASGKGAVAQKERDMKSKNESRSHAESGLIELFGRHAL